MFIVQPQITYDQKQEEIFSILGELKKYDFRVKAYYLWLKAKGKISEMELDKIYDSVMDSMTKIKQEELDRKIWNIKDSSDKIKEMQEQEKNEAENLEEEIEL